MENTKANLPRGFTMMEMLVTIALVVMIITGVGVLTKHMGQLVSTSQASNELLSNVRAAQQMMEYDLMNLDRNGFLIIRGRPNTYDPTKKERYDQLGFMAAGSYPNRTGNDNNGAASNPPVYLMTEGSSANGAIVWYGQCVIEKFGATGSVPAGTNYVPTSTSSANATTALDALPSGVFEQDFVLGRRALALFAPSGVTANKVVVFPQGLPSAMANGLNIPCYSSPAWVSGAGGQITASNLSIPTESNKCHITSGRVASVNQTNEMVMRNIINNNQSAAQIAYAYCYRLRVLQDIYGNNDGAYATNYMRMHPQLLQGCSSFGVDWTDGNYNNATGELAWYGSGNPAPAAYSSAQPGPQSSDDYVACFSYFNRDKWPKAIRISMRVTDRNQRLNGPRDFVHVIRIGG